MTLERKKPLRSSPETNRAWQDRSREKARARDGDRRQRGLERGQGLRRTGRIAPRSKARTTQQAEVRVPMIEQMVAAGRRCEVCPQLLALGIALRCSGRIQGLHERRKAGAGGSRQNPANLVPACNLGNGWIEDEPELARQLGTALVVRESDPEWESLGRRADREACDPG